MVSQNNIDLRSQISDLKSEISSSQVSDLRSPQRTVVGLGEALWDLLPDRRHVGGAPLNFSYISSLLNSRALVLTRVGNDSLGSELRRELARRGIDTNHIQRDFRLPTGTVEVTVSDDAQPSYEIRHPAAWDELEWTVEWRRLAQQSDAVCFGTLSQRAERSRTTIQSFLRETSPECIRVFDVNLRPPYYARDVIVDSLELASIVKFNEAEYSEVTAMVGLRPALNAGDIQAFVRKFDFELVCVTRGDRGSIMATPDHSFEHPGFATEVRDTIGAGDAFTAAVVHCWLSGKNLEVTSQFANCWASWVASQSGGMPLMDEKLRHGMCQDFAQFAF
jgi:fructokinase